MSPRIHSLLAIETSSEACSVALSVDGRLYEAHELAPLRHAEVLLPAVERLLAEAGVGLSALDAIAFGRGPGSFTSLRIGIGVVQGLAWAAGLPVVPISSLAALAQDATDQVDDKVVDGAVDGAAHGHRICVAVDARMQEVFTAEFERGPGGLLRPVGEERVCPASAVAAEPAPRVAAGNGFERFAELQPLCRAAKVCLPDLWPRAAMVLRLAEAWLQTHDPLPAALAQPVYLRNNVAEKP
ncbi:MAG: tRNA (adenosine(37)-N6)-threonylcarbamoyltransferase complex dimerization subunit type 1 TsaB, partial [Lysobacterales bacterium]